MVKVIFITPEEEKIEVDIPEGTTILEAARMDIAHDKGVELEGACEASLACSTCHVIVDAENYAKLPAASEDEDDMLDTAFGLTATSRLGCQVVINKEIDGITLKIPSRTKNETKHEH